MAANEITEESVSSKLKVHVQNLDHDIEHICNVASSDADNCSDHNEEPGVCNSFKENNIPCYYDHESEAAGCKQISKQNKYADNKWGDISRELDGLGYDYEESKSADAFFSCARFEPT